MKTQAVIGLGFGDEGKGTFTAYLCSKSDNPLVVRFSGGHQAGHTVVTKKKRHVFASFGSGTLQGVPTYWGKECTFYPTGFLNELSVLKEKGVIPKIYINAKCPVTTPFDIYQNIESEKSNRHGSCGVGFGATIEREEKNYSLLFEDLFFDSVLRLKLEAIRDFYNINGLLINRFIKDCKEAITKTIPTLPPANSFKSMIFEGSQGLLLDKDIGFFPHVTRGNVGTKNISSVDEVFLVTRAYQTRHGNGPMTNRDIPNNIAENPKETNQWNEHQGDLRRSILDLDLLKYAIKKDGCLDKYKVNLVVTCLDHVENNYWFTHNGDIIRSDCKIEFVDNICTILGIKSAYISESERFEEIQKLF